LDGEADTGVPMTAFVERLNGMVRVLGSVKLTGEGVK
jgi:hypothetical protein